MKFVQNKIGGGKILLGKIKLRADEQLIIYPNLKKAKKFLKWSKITSFETGINKTIKQYKKEIKVFNSENLRIMKVVILAGGKGTRISEYTKSIPKPMIEVGKTLIVHIMQHYAKFGFKDFIVAAGYKQEIIKKYFKNKDFGWNIKIINTGKNTMTGGRLKRLEKYLKDEKCFMFTYGDGISNVNLKKLLKFHLLKKN